MASIEAWQEVALELNHVVDELLCSGDAVNDWVEQKGLEQQVSRACSVGLDEQFLDHRLPAAPLGDGRRQRADLFRMDSFSVHHRGDFDDSVTWQVLDRAIRVGDIHRWLTPAEVELDVADDVDGDFARRAQNGFIERLLTAEKRRQPLHCSARSGRIPAVPYGSPAEALMQLRAAKFVRERQVLSDVAIHRKGNETEDIPDFAHQRRENLGTSIHFATKRRIEVLARFGILNLHDPVEMIDAADRESESFFLST